MKRTLTILLSAVLVCASHLAGAQTAPKIGGYAITTYKYSDVEGANGGEGFSVRLVRFYVSGKILDNVDYKFQAQLNGTPHMRDYYFEWVKFPQFKVKVGQFKRPFTYENPFNPWDLGLGDYSLGVRTLAAIAGDRCGAATAGGRDQGVQIQGDLLPLGEDGLRLLHYQIGVFNGNGINAADNNADKDLIGTLQIQPVKGWSIGAFGWLGDWTKDGITVDRNRWSVGTKYDRDGWTARAEFIKSYGHKISEYDKETGSWSGTGIADAFYVTCGVPVKPWLKMAIAYDQFRDQGNEQTRHSLYSIAANFRPHKNLQLQLSYRYHENKLIADPYYNELWFEAFFRF